jgi:hypothetical protein
MLANLISGIRMPRLRLDSNPRNIERSGAWIWSAAIASGLASTFLQPVLILLLRPYFVYENGTDEGTYLSFQGALALQDSFVRWTSSRLNVLLHELGLSGAWQNLLFDVATLSALCITVFVCLRRYALLDRAEALLVAWIIPFGSILFNNANPLLRNRFPNLRYEETIWMAATDSHLPILRTPEPQLSILIALPFVYWAARIRNPLPLILPLPFLYITFLIGYAYVCGVVVLVFVAMRIWPRLGEVRMAVVANAALYACGAAAFAVIGTLDYARGMVDLRLAEYTHQLKISPNLLFTTACVTMALLLQRSTTKAARISAAVPIATTLIGLQLFLATQQVLSGAVLYPTGLQNVAGSVGSAAAVAMLLLAMRRATATLPFRKAYLGTSALVSLLILVSIHTSQGLDVANKRYYMLINHELGEESYRQIREDPLAAIIPGRILAGSIALSAPRMLAPPFAYSYAFPWYAAICPEAASAHEAAVAFVEANRDHPDLERWLPDLMSDIAFASRGFGNLPAGQEPACSEAAGRASGEPFIVPLNANIAIWLRR